MTHNNEREQRAERDKLATVIETAYDLNPGMASFELLADAALAAGYVKPRQVSSVDEATVERCARALYGTEELPTYDETREKFTGTKPWDWLSEPFQDSYRIKARAVLRAAVVGSL